MTTEGVTCIMQLSRLHERHTSNRSMGCLTRAHARTHRVGIACPRVATMLDFEGKERFRHLIKGQSFSLVDCVEHLNAIGESNRPVNCPP
jgi:hypothetical protein